MLGFWQGISIVSAARGRFVRLGALEWLGIPARRMAKFACATLYSLDRLLGLGNQEKRLIMTGAERIDKLLSFLKDDAEDTFSLFALATEYARQGENQKALTYFEQVLGIDPNYVGTYYHLGKLLEEEGDRERAVRVYRRGISVAESLRDTHSRSELQSALMEAEGVY